MWLLLYLHLAFGYLRVLYRVAMKYFLITSNYFNSFIAISIPGESPYESSVYCKFDDKG